MPQRKDARVLPEPVGAQISVCLPEAIAGQPAACAGVGASNEASNHRWTGSENGSRGDFGVAGVLMANLLTLQMGSPGPSWLRADRLRGMRRLGTRSLLTLAFAALVVGAALAPAP